MSRPKEEVEAEDEEEAVLEDGVVSAGEDEGAGEEAEAVAGGEIEGVGINVEDMMNWNERGKYETFLDIPRFFLFGSGFSTTVVRNVIPCKNK